MSSTRELEKALEESKRSLAEVVEEVVYCERELAKSKALNQKLSQKIQELEQQQSNNDNDDPGQSNAVRSLQRMLQQQQEQFENERRVLTQQRQQATTQTFPKRAEDAIAEERSLREDLERTLQVVMQERDSARSELLAWSMKNNVSKEENKTMEERNKLLKDEFERSQRNAEAAIREQRASEKRFQALADEMRQVMEERDLAVTGRDDARREKQISDNALQKLQKEVEELNFTNQALNERLTNLERQKDAILIQKQNEERLRVQTQANVDGLRAERDAALKENESLTERLDEALGARRLAVAAKGDALKQAETNLKKAEQAEQKMKQEMKKAQDMENRLREAEGEIQRLQDEQNQQTNELRDAIEAANEYEELKKEAEREMEAARRQLQGMHQEMISVLKARDLAVQERDDIASRSGMVPLLEDQLNKNQVNVTDLQDIKTMIQNTLILLEQSPTKKSSSSPSRQMASSDIVQYLKDSSSLLNEQTIRLKEKYRASLRRIDILESKLQESEVVIEELEGLRRQAAESEKALKSLNNSTISSNQDTIRKELRERIQECDTLRKEREELIEEIHELTIQLSRTPKKKEIESLVEKLRTIEADFDRVEAENRRLKGL